MDDPEDKKPDGWDDIPAQIADPEATKPEDWVRACMQPRWCGCGESSGGWGGVGLGRPGWLTTD